jgi:lipopolysaccharide/colanic/teichoic acid biosynthesis glycosyltransferase
MVSTFTNAVSRGSLGVLIKRMRFQLPLVLLTAVVLPAVLFYGSKLDASRISSSGVNAMIGSTVAILLGLYLARGASSTPGIGAFASILPSIVSTFGVVLVAFLMLRLDYSRLLFASSFVVSSFVAVGLHQLAHRLPGRRFYLVPFGATDALMEIDGPSWVQLGEAVRPPDPAAILVADLRADLPDEWERLISDMAVAGHPVYHVKQVLESLTGRVEIEHLSENGFGSLIPDRSYLIVKRIIDLAGAIALLPLLFPVFLVVAIWIKLDTPGPIFFRQVRVGHRGKPFRVLKFRTMVHRGSDATESSREGAMTQTLDPRITRAGRIIRRTRIDELPQIWNVLLGEMSMIGPRPEALPLAKWYEEELPYYSYRHIVRPGISGWAQVNQGHVAQLEEVHEKLHYDFFYIKNLSLSMDFLVVVRTIEVLFSGYGAK